jgi:hypothetical protein
LHPSSARAKWFLAIRQSAIAITHISYLFSPAAHGSASTFDSRYMQRSEAHVNLVR